MAGFRCTADVESAKQRNLTLNDRCARLRTGALDLLLHGCCGRLCVRGEGGGRGRLAGSGLLLVLLGLVDHLWQRRGDRPASQDTTRFWCMAIGATESVQRASASDKFPKSLLDDSPAHCAPSERHGEHARHKQGTHDNGWIVKVVYPARGSPSQVIAASTRYDQQLDAGIQPSPTKCVAMQSFAQWVRGRRISTVDRYRLPHKARTRHRAETASTVKTRR
jgi:hypothetical protein